MRVRVVGALGVLVAGSVLAACGAARSAESANSSVAGTKMLCLREDEHGRWREMTWEEYYADVRERAWRNNALVIWITPPEVHRRPRAAGPELCER